MNRVVNGVFVAVVAFFGVLAVFSFSGFRPPSSEGAGHATLTLVHPRWAPDGDGREIEVLLVVHSEAAKAVASRVEYEVEVNGRVFGEGRVPLDEPLSPGRDSEVRFRADLGEGFARRWLPLHLDGREESELRLRGTLHVQEGEGARLLPFEWTSPWKGSLTGLASALSDCPADGQPLCLAKGSARPRGQGLDVTVEVRNASSQDIWVREGTLRLRLGTQVVGEARVDQALLPEDKAAQVTVRLTFDGDGLDSWWQSHVAGCESSSAGLELRLELEDDYGWPLGTVTWTTPQATFETAFLCNGGA